MSTAKGLAWFFSNTAFSKLLTFVAQIVLGSILMPGDFGLYAIVISIGVFFSMLGNGGVEKVLIQRGDELSDLLPTASVYSLFFNLLAMVLFWSAASTVSEIYSDERLFYMLIIMSLVLPIGTPAAFYRAKLSIDRNYKELAVMKTLGASARQIMIVVLALNGFGVYSFVIPMIIEVVVEILVGMYFTQWFPSLNGFSFSKAKDLFKSCKWLMLGSVMLSLATTGDYFLLGIFLTKDQLGTYFFGLQLVVSVAALFSVAIQGVMLPALVSTTESPSKFGRLFSEAISKIFFISLPVAVLVMVSAEPIINWIWDGKWNAAIPIVQVMSLGMPFGLMVFLGRSGLEALGLWRKRLLYLGVYGFSSMLIAVGFAQTENIFYVAVGVAVIRSIVGIIQSISIFSVIKERYLSVVSQLIMTATINVVCGLIVAIFLWGIGLELGSLHFLVGFFMIFSMIYIVIVKLFQPSLFLSFYNLLKK